MFSGLAWTFMHFPDSSKREDERESQDQTQAETQENFMDNSTIICIKFQEGSKQYNRMPLFSLSQINK